MSTAENQSPARNDAIARRRQWVLAVGITGILAVAGLAAYAMLRPGYEVLFRDLKPRDASAIIAELEKEKVPYKVDEAHAAILVPENDTRATRLKLMSSDLRLSGVVGLELFNNSDLGLTDFAQKVNYQRALQGELARTIMTLDEVEMARVHLTLPEASIFRRDQAQPKASVALFLHAGENLNPDVIRGIQRLIAASVPDMKPADVTVLDSRGSAAASRGIDDADHPQFALKRAIDAYYEQKIATQIEALSLAARASVSVDADIDFDQTKITRESGLTRAAETKEVPSPAALTVAGTDMRSPLPPLPQSDGAAKGGAPVQTNHTLEQIVSSPGAVRRLSVGVAFGEPVTEETRTKLAALISASIGLDPKRGDVLSVLSIPHAASELGEKGSKLVPPAITHPMDSRIEPVAHPSENAWPSAWPWTALGILAILITACFALFRTRTRSPRALTETERRALATRLGRLLEARENAHAKR